MGPEKRLLFLLTVTLLFTPIYGATQYLFFSDFKHCDETYTVTSADVIQIEGKRASEAGTDYFTDCSLLFRAGNLEDKLCMKISTLTFSNKYLQLQYFKSLDPTVGNPDVVLDSAHEVPTPFEMCDNKYEISMTLRSLDASAKLRDVNIVTVVYNMQGTQRRANIDTDCGLHYNLSDSTVFVQNTDPDGPHTLESVCQLYFNYVGSKSNQICIKYQKTKDTCGYEIKVYDGDVTGSNLAHTYTCSNTQPQQWCGTGSSIYLELEISGTDPLPVGVFAVEVYDETKPSTPEASAGSFIKMSLPHLLILMMGVYLLQETLQALSLVLL